MVVNEDFAFDVDACRDKNCSQPILPGARVIVPDTVYFVFTLPDEDLDLIVLVRTTNLCSSCYCRRKETKKYERALENTFRTAQNLVFYVPTF